MKILITGGCGFVGRALIKKLLTNEDHEIYCVDNLIEGGGGIHPKFWIEEKFLIGKNRRFFYMQEDCRDFFKNNKNDFEEIYHLAAVVGGRATIENNPIAVATDLSIDSEMWIYATKNSSCKVIHFSSSAAYPISMQKKDDFKVLEEKDIDFSNQFLGIPDLTYGWAKLTSEYMGLIANSKHNVRSITYRPFSGYGIDQDLSYPFPAIMNRALNHKIGDIFYVWGSGSQTRDFIHIDDCVNAVLKTKDLINDGSAINLCTGIKTSFYDLANTALRKVFEDKIIEVKGLSDQPEGVFNRVGDPTKLMNSGYIPKIRIEDGVENAVKQLKNKKASSL